MYTCIDNLTYHNSKVDATLCLSLSIFAVDLIIAFVSLSSSLDENDGTICMDILLPHNSDAIRIAQNLKNIYQ